MLKRLETSLITTVFIVITAIILIIYSKQREQEFKAYNISTQETIVNGAAYAINMKLLDKRRNVQLFVNEYARHLNQLALTPNNEKFVDNIKTRLQQRFQDYFTYTITNKQGIPKLDNMDELVGQVCQVDIKNYAKNLSNNNSGKLQNKVIIHPQPFNYHYDIMTPLYDSNAKDPSIFFVSFYLKEIIHILNTHELPNQYLMLVRQSDSSLIEVTSKGERNKLKREIRLTKQEQEQINVSKNIPGTDWRLVSLPDSAHQKQYIKGLWIEAIVIILIVMFALLLLTATVRKVSKKRKLNHKH